MIYQEANKEKWEKEYISGKWDYLDKNPVERSRHAVIAMFCSYYFPKGRILDVGCGVGTLVDFLNSTQRKNYLGIDISEKAIKVARIKRKAKFLAIDSKSFGSRDKYDVIVFNEMLYYVDLKNILTKYQKLLNRNGLFIISLFSTMEHKEYRPILKTCNKLFKTLNSLDISGEVKKRKVTWRVRVFSRH